MKKLVLAFMMGAAAMAANAQVNYKVQTACHPQDVKHYDTELLRSRFMMDKVMAPDEINVTYTLYDRLIYGGAMPVNKTLKLEGSVNWVRKSLTSSNAANWVSSIPAVTEWLL